MEVAWAIILELANNLEVDDPQGGVVGDVENACPAYSVDYEVVGDGGGP